MEARDLDHSNGTTVIQGGSTQYREVAVRHHQGLPNKSLELTPKVVNGTVDWAAMTVGSGICGGAAQLI